MLLTATRNRNDLYLRLDQRGYARKNANDDAREVADPIFDVGSPNVRYWALATIPCRI